MQTKWIWALAVLNAVLLTGLITHWMPSRADAQAAASYRPGDYLMIPGDIQGGPGGALVYIIDNNTGLLSARQFTGQLNGPVADAPPLDLNRLLNRRAP
jgi:hypothetical protein